MSHEEPNPWFRCAEKYIKIYANFNTRQDKTQTHDI